MDKSKTLSYATDTERIIKQEFSVNANLDKVWEVCSTKDGLQSWFAPVVAVDWKRGGTIKSRYSQDGVIGERNTVTTVIVDYIPKQRITLMDNLTFLLSYGMSQNWITDVSNEFMFELIADGGEIFTSLAFEEISLNEVKITVYMTGFKLGGEWEKRYKSTISSNDWTYKKLIKRFEKGPIDWSAIK